MTVSQHSFTESNMSLLFHREDNSLYLKFTLQVKKKCIFVTLILKCATGILDDSESL